MAPLKDVKADLIVSEWMGYFLIFERMLPSVLAVRDKCLADDGEMIPRRAKLLVAAYEGEELDFVGGENRSGNYEQTEAVI